MVCMNRYGARPRQLAAGRGDENRKDGKLAVGTHIRTARRTHLVNSNAARPQAAVAGESISFNHTSRDYFGNLLRRGGEAFSASLTPATAPAPALAAAVRDVGDGSYVVSYRPVIVGCYLIKVMAARTWHLGGILIPARVGWHKVGSQYKWDPSRVGSQSNWDQTSPGIRMWRLAAAPPILPTISLLLPSTLSLLLLLLTLSSHPLPPPPHPLTYTYRLLPIGLSPGRALLCAHLRVCHARRHPPTSLHSPPAAARCISYMAHDGGRRPARSNLARSNLAGSDLARCHLGGRGDACGGRGDVEGGSSGPAREYADERRGRVGGSAVRRSGGKR